MAKVFEFIPSQGSFKDRVSGTIPTNTSVLIKNTERGRAAFFPSGAELNGFGTLSGIKTVALWINPSGNGDILLDDGVAKLSITAGSIAGTGLTQCYINDVDTDVIAFNTFSLVIAEFSAGIDFSTDVEIDPTMVLFLASCRCDDALLTTSERTARYQEFLDAQTFMSDPVLNRGEFSATNFQMVSLDGINWNATGETCSAGHPCGDFRVASGSFQILEDATGKYIECVTNGVLQLTGINLSRILNNGYLKQVVGDLSAEQGKAVNASSLITFANNTISITMTAGQTLRSFAISQDDALYEESIAIQSTGASLDLGFIATGSPEIRWHWSDGSVSSGKSPGVKYFGSAATRQHQIYLADWDAAITQALWNGKGLSGAIPAELGNLTSLITLLLHSNTLSGAIPAALGNLSSLQSIYLYSNTLSGAIPAALGNLSSLQYLKLHNNTFSQADLSDFVNVLWLNRVVFGGNSCDIKLEGNNGLTATAIAQIEGTGVYAGDGLKDAGCTVTY